MSIVIKNLNKIYPDGHHALKNINLNIPSGMFGLLGPNGAGKSTLMRILVAQMEATSGEIEMYGYNMLKDRKAVRSILGYLPQDFRFFAQYKTWEFLDYAARLSGMTQTSRRRDAVDKMLESVGLYEVRNRYANKLSGGMKRRLGIAQALIHDPKVIVVDEPTTGLDPEERIRFRNLLSKVSGQDTTIILSTHIVGDISSTCNHMALLNKGEVSFYGSPQDMLVRATGKVWRVMVKDEDFVQFTNKYPVVATIPHEGEWELQVIADQIEGYDAEAYTPNLEHAYVYFMESQLDNWTND